MKNIKLALFDCDNTLWYSHDNDYISSVTSQLSLHNGCVIRISDNKQFFINTKIKNKLLSLHAKGVQIGIVSDNVPKPVIDALQLFDLLRYINQDAINIKLWNGYCPKEKMVLEVLAKPFAKSILPSQIVWYDDKDYTKQAHTIGTQFVHVKP